METMQGGTLLILLAFISIFHFIEMKLQIYRDNCWTVFDIIVPGRIWFNMSMQLLLGELVEYFCLFLKEKYSHLVLKFQCECSNK